MKVLVYGAGVIGGQIAHALCISGNEVTILARGAWAETLRRTGLRIHHYIQRTDTTDWPHVIEKLDNKAYDAVFAVMQYRQMEKILPDLAAVNSPLVVLTGNNLSAGEMEAMILKNTTVPKTVLFGFGSTAGVREKASPDGFQTEADVSVDYYDKPSAALQLVPHILHLGIGCRKGTSAEALEAGLDGFCRERSILPEAIRSAASIDLKSGEEGLLRFCGKHGWPIRFYTAEELGRAEGSFSGSDFVRSVAGVDNVCERAAVLKSSGKLRETKYAQDGVTFALAEEEASFDWSW